MFKQRKEKENKTYNTENIHVLDKVNRKIFIRLVISIPKSKIESIMITRHNLNGVSYALIPIGIT